MSAPPRMSDIVASAARTVSAIGELMQRLGLAAQQSGREIAALLARIQLLDRRSRTRRAQDRLGWRNRTGEGLWQSDLCAGWLHADCGLPAACDCTCHGGPLR